MASTPSRLSASYVWKSAKSNFTDIKAHYARSSNNSSRLNCHISLRHIIGDTTSSVNGFHHSPAARRFAYVAGNAAVVAELNDRLEISSQRYFRAPPTAVPINQTASLHAPSTPSSVRGPRSRVYPTLKEGVGLSSRGSPVGDWADSPGSKATSVRERTKAATCLSLSPNGRVLAVGETGYKPRVLLFSTAEDACQDQPLAALTEHTFGVQMVAFSPDSQYLASLGSLNDGFVHIWQINRRTGAATLYASNKCTSTIKHMAWMGASLVTVGVRHVKIWRVADENQGSFIRRRLSDGNQSISSPATRILCGRNCLLGSLLESTFCAVVPFSPYKAIVCAEAGHICLLNDEAAQELQCLRRVDFQISCAAIDEKSRLWVAGLECNLKTYDVSDLCSRAAQPLITSSPLPSPVRSARETLAYFVAMGIVGRSLICIDSHHTIHVLDSSSGADEKSHCSPIQRIAAHSSAILGVQFCHPAGTINASFYTWSADGSVLFWSFDGVCTHDVMIPLEQALHARDDGFVNELRVVLTFSELRQLASGDKEGVLRVTEVGTRSAVFEAKAHAGEITDIAVTNVSDAMLLASCGRDRVIQLFRETSASWVHIQTLDYHTSAVTGLLFIQGETRLLSFSADRTIVVAEPVTRLTDQGQSIALRALRTITLKKTPLTVTPHPLRMNAIAVATADRQMVRYDIDTGRAGLAFKASDSDYGDAVVVSKLTYVVIRGIPLLAAISSTDKSLRLYAEDGNLVGRAYGHTEGVSGIAALQPPDQTAERRCLVTVGLDGTIFLWNLASEENHTTQVPQLVEPLDAAPDSTKSKEPVASRRTLRRVLSHSELAEFSGSADEGIRTQNALLPGNQHRNLHTKGSRRSLAPGAKVDSIFPARLSKTLRGRPSYASSPSIKVFGSPSPPTSPGSRAIHSKQPHELPTEPQSRARPRATSNELGNLASSTEQLCRALRVYRKKLAASADSLDVGSVRLLERELGLTARALGEKAAKTNGVSETAMVKLLDQYSERLVEMLDGKIAASVAERVMQKGQVEELSADDGAVIA